MMRNILLLYFVDTLLTYNCSNVFIIQNSSQFTLFMRLKRAIPTSRRETWYVCLLRLWKEVWGWTGINMSSGAQSSCKFIFLTGQLVWWFLTFYQTKLRFTRQDYIDVKWNKALLAKFENVEPLLFVIMVYICWQTLQHEWMLNWWVKIHLNSYPAELEINDTTESNTSASYLD